MHNRLKEVGYEITAVENGAQGLTLARETRFDLFLVDAGLNSGIGSVEVCRRLKQMPHNAGVPLIVLGKTAARDELPKGYEAGADACLVKSDLQVLEHVLRVFLRHKRKHDELCQQLRILDDQNRRLVEERQRTNALEHANNGASDPAAVWRDMAPGRPDGVLVVDEEGVVRFGDRGAHEIFGGGVEGKNLGRLAPTSGLEACVRDVHSEKRDGLRFDIVSRNGRAGRSLLASVIPMVGQPGEADPGMRIVLLLDAGKRRVAAELMRLQEYTLPQREVGVLLDAARVAYGTASLIGPSATMTQVRAQMSDAARLHTPILIVGEAGSGRQHAARALHFSREPEGPFLPVACAGFSPEHLDAEIFGQVKGAFADAILDRPGALQQAAHGTVFLQDVENLPLNLQAKLVRAIRDHATVRAGSDRPEPIEVRVIASTSIDLAAATASRGFDPELLQLLAATVIRIAPLRDRPEDIDALTSHFLRLYGGGRPHLEVADDAMARIHTYAWPGNVLELKSCIERACKRSLNGRIALDHLAPAVRDLPGERPAHEIVPMPAPARASLGTHSVGAHTLPPQITAFPPSLSGVPQGLRPGEIGSEDP